MKNLKTYSNSFLYSDAILEAINLDSKVCRPAAPNFEANDGLPRIFLIASFFFACDKKSIKS